MQQKPIILGKCKSRYHKNGSETFIIKYVQYLKKCYLRDLKKLPELLVRAQWITASSADCAAKQYKQFFKDDEVYSFVKSFAMNERIVDPYPGLLTKFPFSIGDRKHVVKKIILSHGNASIE